MRSLPMICALLFCSLQFCGQTSFRIIVPKEPIIEGQSFRVQYVAQDIIRMNNINTPAFTGFRLVSNGPEIYATPATTAEGRHTQNTIFTLQAKEPGRYRIPPASATIDGKLFVSDAAWVTVISEENALKQQRQNGSSGDNFSTALLPGQDPEKFVKDNLFVKVTVNKNSCFTGEAVVATFKLYSRLQSKSEIVKNPGFYGFSVHDMVGLADRSSNTEKINGKSFEVHTIRQVQLYPLQAGDFTIDPMEIQNRVEFSRTTVSRKNEQEIEEGIHDPSSPSSTEYYENSISTPPVIVHVKAVPVKNKPEDYSGATGRFSLTASFEKTELSRNEEGYLLITVTGKGNFSQISAPVIAWPQGIEGFEPSVKDNTDKMQAPLTGTRTFRYAFVSANAGIYELPIVRLAYFNPDSNNYGVASAKPGIIQISYAEKKPDAGSLPEAKENIGEVNKKASMIAGIVVGLGLITVLCVLLFRKKKPAVEKQIERPPLPVINEIFQPATMLIAGGEKEFYGYVYRTAWSWLGERFNLSGSKMNKQELLLVTTEKDRSTIDELAILLSHCETGMYTTATLEDDKEALIERIKFLLKQLD